MGTFLAIDAHHNLRRISDVLPMTIYTEFTLNANFVTAAALSIMLGIITWIALYIARSLAGSSVAAAA